MEATNQADQFATGHLLEQLLIERNAQRVGKLEIAGTLRIFLQPLLGLQFIGGHSDPFDGEVASRRVFECQQGQ